MQAMDYFLLVLVIFHGLLTVLDQQSILFFFSLSSFFFIPVESVT